jgi:hypothetical protein
LIGNHDLPLYRISHPPLFYHKDGDSKIQAAYDRSVRRALDDPFHPSMQFKPLVGNVWFARIGDHYRTVAQKHSDLVVWFWIGTHKD